MSARRSALLRRYPALGFLAIAAVLALMLPTALRVPLSSPSSQAEVAPVSGHSDAQGALSDLNGASSGGLGSGAGTGAGVGDRSGSGSGPSQVKRKPAQVKACIGKPPRQTEDPLSPSCVPFFEGDNGGATTRGVTTDEITVVVDTPPVSGDRWHDWNVEPSPTDDATDRLGRALARYFNDRYQTYGRKVHLWRFIGSTSASEPDKIRADIERIDTERHPFAIIPLLDNGAEIALAEAANRNILALGHQGFARAVYEGHRPYLMTWAPDLEEQAAHATNFVCRKLTGHPARFSSEFATATRSFGIFYEGSAGAPNMGRLAKLVHDGLAQACNIDAVTVHAASDSTQQAATEYTTALTALIQANVTSVIDIASGGASENLSNRASAQGYYPEWILPGGGVDDAGPDRDVAGQLHNQAEWRGAFGFSYDTRRDALDRQPWTQAFREGCPSCPESRLAQSPNLYEEMTLLFFSIQAAGPRLTPPNIDKGMHGIPAHRSSDPYAPAAYFAPGNWSFIKDAMEIWWDGSAPPPGETKPGCYRLPSSGARSRAGDWTGDDSEFFTGTPPCQGVTYHAS